MSEFSCADARRMLDALPPFFEALFGFFNTHAGVLYPDSPAQAERSAYLDPATIDIAYDFGTSFVEAASDHLVAFHKTMIEPVAVFGPWVCVRSVLELSAYAAWILDSRIDAGERALRSFALRYKNLDEQSKFARSRKTESAADEPSIEAITSEVLNKARGLRIPVLKDKKNRISGLGVQLPSATEVVAKYIHDEPSYRMLSGMAHGLFWVMRSCYEFHGPDDGLSDRVILKKRVAPHTIGYLTARAVRAFAIALWLRSHQLGWDLALLRSILEKTYDDMRIVDGERFWR